MMRLMMKRELSIIYRVLKKVSVYILKEEDKLYCCGIPYRTWGHIALDGEEETINPFEVVYNTLNEENHPQTITDCEYLSCEIDVIKQQWVRMSENEYMIKEVIPFQFEQLLYVRLVLTKPFNYDGPTRDISRIEFAFGNITFGVSYIIPGCVWEERGHEIEAIFKDKIVEPSYPQDEWEVVATI